MLRSNPFNCALALVAILAGVTVPTLSFAEGSTPFSQLAGSWKGSGQVRLDDGRSERLSCRGYYVEKAKGAELSIAIRCQSDTNKIEMRSGLTYENGRVNGHWEERTFSAEGTMSGSASANKLNLRISGQVTGSMSVSVNGSTHRVGITTAGPGFKGVTITFSRG